jgi:hypothetical protein
MAGSGSYYQKTLGNGGEAFFEISGDPIFDESGLYTVVPHAVSKKRVATNLGVTKADLKLVPVGCYVGPSIEGKGIKAFTLEEFRIYVRAQRDILGLK